MSLNDRVCTRNQSKPYKHNKNISCQVEQGKNFLFHCVRLVTVKVKVHAQELCSVVTLETLQKFKYSKNKSKVSNPPAQKRGKTSKILENLKKIM